MPRTKKERFYCHIIQGFPSADTETRTCLKPENCGYALSCCLIESNGRLHPPSAVITTRPKNHDQAQLPSA